MHPGFTAGVRANKTPASNTRNQPLDFFEQMTKRERQMLEYALENLASGDVGEALFGSGAEAVGGPVDGQLIRQCATGLSCITSFASGVPTHHWYELKSWRKGNESRHQYEYMGVGTQDEPPCKEEP